MVADPRSYLILPYPGFGHIIPLLELSRKIVKSGRNVTFALSNNSLTDMRNRTLLSPDDETVIHFIGLQDGISHPDDGTLSIELISDLTEKLNCSLEGFLGKVVAGNQRVNDDNMPGLPIVDVIIADLNLGEVPFRIAHRANIPIVAFVPFGGHTLLRMLQVNEDTPVASDEDLLKEVKPGTIFQSWKQQLLKTQEGLLLADRLLISSFEALEPTFASDLVSMCPRFAHIEHGFVGPIFPVNYKRDAPERWSCNKVINWLDGQKQRSTVYISFGSFAVANAEQIQEMYMALISSGRPFIWSLRPSQQKYLPADIQQAVGQQYENAKAPYLILDWAPQKDILKHNSIRVFISHCGWNSVLESISSGVPIVAWPAFADQHDNADLLEKAGCGLKIQQVDMSGQRIVKQEELLDILDQVAQWDKPLKLNRFFMSAQNLGNEAREALRSEGSSLQTFESLMTIAHG